MNHQVDRQQSVNKRATLSWVAIISSLLVGLVWLAYMGVAEGSSESANNQLMTTIWINEFHYDNDGADTGEGVEIAGPAGADLTGWSVVLYNGSGGAAYATISLSGTLPNAGGSCSGYGMIEFAQAGIQNGGPDGLALVDDTGSVIQFLSYEGVMTATDGPASGLTSTDIGVSETGTTPVGDSLQLTGGPGSTYEDFTWSAPSANTFGTCNTGQTFDGGGPATAPIINEFVANHVGTDTNEFVEIKGDPATDYTGYSVVIIEGDGDSPGQVDQVYAIGTTDANGYWVTNFLSDQIENGSLTFYVVEGFSGTVGDDLDVDDDGVLDSTPWTQIVDDVAVHDGDMIDFVYSTVILTGTFDANPLTPGGASRLPDGMDTDMLSDWTRNDFDGAGLACCDPGTPEAGEALNTPNQTNEAVTVAPASLLINEVDSDTPSNPTNDNDEFIELYDGGTGNSSLDGYVIVLFNGNNNASYAAYDLDGQTTDANGYFVLGGPGIIDADMPLGGASQIQNGADAVALYQADGADFPTGSAVTTVNLVDALVYDTSDPDDPELLVLLNSGQPQVSENGGGSQATESNQRCPNGSGGARNTDTYTQALPTPGAENCPPTADLSVVTGSTPRANVNELQAITYVITVTSAGSSQITATNVVVDIDLPAIGTEVAYVGNSCGGTLNGNTVVWAVGDVPVGAEMVCAVDVTVQSGTNGLFLRTYGHVSASDTPDPDSAAGNFLTNPQEDDESVVTVHVGPTACGTGGVTLISAVQGNCETCSMSTPVVIEGVVTADSQSAERLGGFFIQEEDGDQDGDPLTSEGVFVYDLGFGMDFKEGDLVRIAGTPVEYFGFTEVEAVTAAYLCSTGNSVTPATITLPIPTPPAPYTSGTQFEMYEGMLVNFTQDLYVIETYNLGRFGEFAVSHVNHLPVPSQIHPPSTNPASPLQLQVDENRRSRLLIDDSQSGQNPDPVIFPAPGLTYDNPLRNGDSLAGGIVAPLGYSFGEYRLYPQEALTFTPNPRELTAPDVGGNVKVVAANVLNYVNTLNTGNVCGPNDANACFGADTASELERQEAKLVAALLGLDADVYTLIEVENDGYDAGSAIVDLVAALNAATAPGTYDFVDFGVPFIPATDPLRSFDPAQATGFIYRTDVITEAGTAVYLNYDSPYFIDDYPNELAYHDGKNRPSVAQTFEYIPTGDTFTVVGVHFKSKGGNDCSDWGDVTIDDGQGLCSATRLWAVRHIAAWLATNPTGVVEDKVLVMGDFNAYYMEDASQELVANHGYTHVLTSTDYSYVFSGEWGTLDQILASPTMSPYVTGSGIWHVSSDEPRVFDYNEEFKTASQLTSWYAPTPFRYSDHDPVLVGLSFGCVAPSDTDVTASWTGGTQVGLTWNDVSAASYDVYRSVLPDYTRSAATLLSNETGLMYTDPDGIGMENYVYFVEPKAGCGATASSDAVGVFTYGLTAGQ